MATRAVGSDKPSPVYLTVMTMTACRPAHTLIVENSHAGLSAVLATRGVTTA